MLLPSVLSRVGSYGRPVSRNLEKTEQHSCGSPPLQQSKAQLIAKLLEIPGRRRTARRRIN